MFVLEGPIHPVDEGEEQDPAPTGFVAQNPGSDYGSAGNRRL